MRIIAFKTLKDFWEKPANAEAEQPLRAWFHEAKNASWNHPNDIKRQYTHANIVGNNRVAFNIKENTFRLMVTVDYSFKIVFIRFVGTHAEYDKIDAKNI